MHFQTSMQSILVNIFRTGLLRLSSDTYEATASTAAAVVSIETALAHFRSVWCCSESVFSSSKGKKKCDYYMISWPKRIKIGAKKF